MATRANVQVHDRLLTIDGYGRLQPPYGDPIDLITDELEAVIVLWNRDDDGSWRGWLKTGNRRSVSFSALDLEDPVFQHWLRALPGWDHDKLWRATMNPGQHLVWQRSGSEVLGAHAVELDYEERAEHVLHVVLVPP